MLYIILYISYYIYYIYYIYILFLILFVYIDLWDEDNRYYFLFFSFALGAKIEFTMKVFFSFFNLAIID